jgi:MscS family membrane protein
MKYILNIVIAVFFFQQGVFAENPLTPHRLNSPRETMQVFMDSMNEYKKGIETNNEEKISKIAKAVQCLDLKDIPPLLRHEKSEETAIFLKEILDRIYLPNYKTIPGGEADNVSILILKWVVPDTEITITKVEGGDRNEEFLFSAETVNRMSEFYGKVKHLPYLKGSGGGADYTIPWREKMFPAWSMKLFAGVFVWQWIGILVSFVIGLILKYISKLIFFLILKITHKTGIGWDDKIIVAINKPGGYLLGISVLFLYLYSSDISGKLFTILLFIFKSFLSFSFVYLIYNISDLIVSVFTGYISKKNNPLGDQLIPLLGKTIKVTLLVMAVLISIQNLGINVVSILAGLGIGGLAIALAAKDTAANLFGSAMIFLDRPFKVGDHILTNSVEGIVEEVGFRSTLLRTFNDSLVSIPNSIVANSNIDNMGARRSRRTNVTLNVEYGTSPEKMEAFLEGIKNIIKKHPQIQKDNYLVAFKAFASSSLDVWIHFYASVEGTAQSLDLNQNIFIEIMYLGKELDVKFAFPTQTIHVDSIAEKTAQQIPIEKTITEFSDIVKDFKEDGKFSRPNGLGIFTPPYKEVIIENNQGLGV